jgi:hypothetical protein
MKHLLTTAALFDNILIDPLNVKFLKYMFATYCKWKFHTQLFVLFVPVSLYYLAFNSKRKNALEIATI